MTQRISEVVRNTNETKIRVRLNLDGTGQGTLNTGVPFLDHMIDQIKRHGLFDIDIHCDGDLEIDDHHTVEDCGITLGQAFAQVVLWHLAHPQIRDWCHIIAQAVRELLDFLPKF